MTNREAYERDCNELEQYREIGTVEQVRNQKHNLEMAYKIISDYEAIGTVEECREAVLRRFTTKHEVKRLNEQERYEMASKFLADVDFDYDDDWLIGICERDNTQAGLMNELVEALVERYVEDDR